MGTKKRIAKHPFFKKVFGDMVERYHSTNFGVNSHAGFQKMLYGPKEGRQLDARGMMQIAHVT